MKQVIVFYYRDAGAAKLRSRELAANKPNNVRTFDVSVWSGDPTPCDEIVIMPCVPAWQVKRIRGAYPGLQLPNEPPVQDEQTIPSLTATHRGNGRWHVTRGEEEISGPHSKAEATRLVFEGNKEVSDKTGSQ